MCKKFYLESIEKELSDNFELIDDLSVDDIVNRHIRNFVKIRTLYLITNLLNYLCYMLLQSNTRYLLSFVSFPPL